MFKVGDKVSIKPPRDWKMKGCKGRLVHIFESGKTPDEELIRIFYEIDETHKIWKGVNRLIHTDRYVIHKEGTNKGFVILPTSTLHVLRPYNYA